jgi:hypothetical protein
MRSRVDEITTNNRKQRQQNQPLKLLFGIYSKELPENKIFCGLGILPEKIGMPVPQYKIG